MRIQIPAGAGRILRCLGGAGYEAQLVGGCVRDLLRGAAPHDWDICTSALPEQVLTCLSGRRVLTTGLKHGTVTVLEEDGAYEVTTYRVDGAYTDGRRPDGVRFVTALEDDLARRDFTMNAIAMDAGGVLHDPFGGAADIAAGVVRCVGEPERRFGEDGLRVLRALRFAGLHSGGGHGPGRPRVPGHALLRGGRARPGGVHPAAAGPRRGRGAAGVWGRALDLLARAGGAARL